MSILTQKPQSSIMINDTEIGIETDFRFFIDYEIEMYHSENVFETVVKFLTKFYKGKLPKNIDLALDMFNEFYLGGKNNSKKSRGGGSGEKAYYYDFDAEYIYSAMLDQYKIDIQTIEYLHWWKFLAMFKSLKADCKISEIMGYRIIKIDSKMSKEQKSFYNKMKDLYAPPKSDADIKHDNEAFEMLQQMKRGEYIG